MRLTLTIKPDAVLIGKDKIPDELIPQFAFHSKVIDKSQPDKLVVDFRGLQAMAWRLPFSILKQLY